MTTYAYSATDEKDQATSKIYELRPDNRHQLGEPTNEPAAADKEGAVQPCELFTFLD